jgi:hypothetical protein
MSNDRGLFGALLLFVELGHSTMDKLTSTRKLASCPVGRTGLILSLGKFCDLGLEFFCASFLGRLAFV